MTKKDLSLVSTKGLTKQEWIPKVNKRLPSMRLDSYYVDLHRERVNKCQT